MSQTERLFFITRRLKETGRVAIRDICEEFEVDERTAKRDISYLRDRCDCDIVYDRKSRVYTAKKPVDIFSPGRNLLFLSYVAGMARSLSLLPVVSDEIKKQTAKVLDKGHLSLASAIFYQFPAVEAFDYSIMDELLQAFKERCVCSIVYTKPGSKEEQRLIKPLRFINYGGQWYVLAYCRKSGAKRQFSLSRIRSATRTGEDYCTLINDDELNRIVMNSYGIMKTSFAESDPVYVTIRFSGNSAGIVASQEWHPAQEMKRGTSDGKAWIELILPVESYEEIMRRVLFFGPEAEAVSPEDFRELWMKNIREMYERYC